MSIVLAIESAIAGGSVSVLTSGLVREAWIGNGDVSAAEELLPAIEGVLRLAAIELSDVDMIAVSNGPGSFTGIRIGIATALGLARADGLKCIGISLLDAIAAEIKLQKPLIVAVPFGRNDVVWQQFGDGPFGDPRAEPLTEFVRHLQNNDLRAAVAANLYDRLSEFVSADRLFDVGCELSSFLGRAAFSQASVSPPSPLYVRRSDGPASTREW